MLNQGKRTILVRRCTISLLVLLVACPAWPQQSGAAPSTDGPEFVLRRQLEADVSKVGANPGLLLLKTAAGRLTFHAPGPATAALRTGERVLVDLALFYPAHSASAADDALNPPLLTQRLSAEITSIQRGIGRVALKTPAGTLNVELPAAAIGARHTGDVVALELAIRHEPDPAALPQMERLRNKGALATLLFLIFRRSAD